MDVLADLLTVGGVRSTVGATIDAGHDWGWWAAPTDDAALHAVTAGSAWLAVAGHEPLELGPGDVVLLPTGSGHVLGSDRAAVERTGPQRFDPYVQHGAGQISIGAPPGRSQILCAHYTHDPAASTPLLSLLPDLVHLPADRGGECLADTVRLLGRELALPQIAGTIVLDRLVDVLLVQLLRAWLAHAPDAATGSLLGALRDPLVGAALARLHAEPARAWTIDALAAELAVSRATLARRFTAAVGTTPGAYLTRWRMDLAARALRDTDQPVEAVAAAVGYTSPYAFNRAFSRARSQPPGRYRAAARAA
jgi:AraC-like DNA-binding protein